MAALVAGKKAPQFRLPRVNGGEFWLDQELQKGPVVAAFFKISCPICQFALPYLERIYQATKGKGVSIVGISQNNLKDTQFFNRQYGISFPTVLDDPKKYEVSNAYELTNVPTIFYIGQSGAIEISSVGWAKNDVLEIARRVSEIGKMPEIPVIRPGENVPAFQAG